MINPTKKFTKNLQKVTFLANFIIQKKNYKILTKLIKDPFRNNQTKDLT